jgi:ABC-type Mn2+/Zn2+ transport system ATPase subunit
MERLQLGRKQTFIEIRNKLIDIGKVVQTVAINKHKLKQKLKQKLLPVLASTNTQGSFDLGISPKQLIKTVLKRLRRIRKRNAHYCRIGKLSAGQEQRILNA